MTTEYPYGYKPMTDDDHLFYLKSDASNIQMMIDHEQAVLARLPRQNAEREALVRRIDAWFDNANETTVGTKLMTDIRAHLVGGGK